MGERFWLGERFWRTGVCFMREMGHRPCGGVDVVNDKGGVGSLDTDVVVGVEEKCIGDFNWEMIKVVL